MLTEWLEKEASSEMAKTAAQQFEEELAALDAPSIARMWRQKKEAAEKEDNREKRYRGAVAGGALGGSITPALYGALEGGAHGGGTGALLGGAALGALGAGSGALGGHVYESEWGERHPIGRYAVPWLLGGTGGLGGAALGARLAGGRKDEQMKLRDSGSKWEKTSSVNHLKLAALRMSRG